MEIQQWDITEAPKLTRVYNEQIAEVPYCYPVSPEEFEKGIRATKKHLHSDQLIIGKQNGEIIGFAHAAVEDKDTGGGKVESVGCIRFLTYERGHRPAGQA